MVVACSRDFELQIVGLQLEFVELVISRNANTGVAEKTEQPKEERERINAFLEATREGPLETLILQAEHRKLDMLFEPEYLADQIQGIQRREKVDLYLVDQLSYGVTIALYLLGLPFVSFCPAHPYPIPVGRNLYGVPPLWPEVVATPAGDAADSSPPIDAELLQHLRELSVQVEEHFTNEFNTVLRRSAPEQRRIGNAFRFTSYPAVLYNYPEFDPGREIAGAGAQEEALKGLPERKALVRSFVPQIRFLPQMDLFVHHGGNNSFTESLYYGAPTILLPFSSDQFNVARDAESQGVAPVLNPNRFSEPRLAEAARQTLESDRSSVAAWSRWVRERGPAFGVRRLQLLGNGVPADRSDQPG